MLSRREGLARVRVHPRRGRRAALARWQGRVSAVFHTRPNHSPVSLQRPVCWGSSYSPAVTRFFWVFLVLDRHEYRVTGCVHRRNTDRTSRIATLTLLSVVACFQGCYFVLFILAGGDTAKMGHFVVSADY